MNYSRNENGMPIPNDNERIYLFVTPSMTPLAVALIIFPTTLRLSFEAVV